MSKNPAPLLSLAQAEHAQQIGQRIRAGEVAPLVGAGLSIPRGLPRWPELVDRLILAWREWDRSAFPRRLSSQNLVRLVRQNFENDLAIVSYLRQRTQSIENVSFGQLLYSALYYPFGIDKPFNPEPSDVHRHLLQLFADHPRRVWTTNYDDLLEEAARLLGWSVATRDPGRRRASREFAVAHLHGFLPPPSRTVGHPDPGEAETLVTLGEDDFHTITSDVIGWTNREFHRLFDEYRVLILGMSLDDPNVRRVLLARPGAQTLIGAETRHFALLREVSVAPGMLPRIQAGMRNASETAANAMRTWHWQQYGVSIVGLPDYATILPFLVRLRYESEGDRPGWLWHEGARRGYAAIHPWDSAQQETARNSLEEVIDSLRSDFDVLADEIVEIGIFLLRPGSMTLELTFRAGSSKAALPGAVEFSADPDQPTGVAGRVFVSGDVVRVARNDALHNFGLSIPAAHLGTSYEGIISVPLIDWDAGGLPLGVMYLTTTTTNGRLFTLPPQRSLDTDDSTLDDLYGWLQFSGLSLLNLLR